MQFRKGPGGGGALRQAAHRRDLPAKHDDPAKRPGRRSCETMEADYFAAGAGAAGAGAGGGTTWCIFSCAPVAFTSAFCLASVAVA